jgi:hypothetical protein
MEIGSIASTADSMDKRGYKVVGGGSMLSGVVYVKASASELCGVTTGRLFITHGLCSRGLKTQEGVRDVEPKA